MEESFLWPREMEGNIYNDNWSLCEDGVVPTGIMFRNARLPVLTSRLPVKVESGKAVVENPKYAGKYVSLEAGDGIAHEAFAEALTAQQTYLSSGVDLFVEDAFMGTSASGRVGVRVVTDSPATALIARTLMVRIPLICVNSIPLDRNKIFRQSMMFIHQTLSSNKIH